MASPLFLPRQPGRTAGSAGRAVTTVVLPDESVQVTVSVKDVP
jgi:hypothetical protein